MCSCLSGCCRELEALSQQNFCATSQVAAAAVATSYGLDARGSISGRGESFFSLHSIQTGSGTNSSPSLMSYLGSFLGDKAVEA
jgi:hypothetical protein